MNKIKTKTLIPILTLLIAITVSLFCNITQAEAQCNIIWWGTQSGYAPTSEYEIGSTINGKTFEDVTQAAPISQRQTSLSL